MDKGLIASDNREALQSSLHEFAVANLPDDQQENFKHFIDLYLDHFPLDTLLGRRVSDVYWCCFSLWNYLAEGPDEDRAAIRVFNPNLEEHKWACNKTVLMVSQRDMPFLVDSMRVELNKAACLVHVVKSTVLYVKRDNNGHIVALASGAGQPEKYPGYSKEALMYGEVNLHTDEESRNKLAAGLESVFKEVEVVVADYSEMLEKLQAASENLATADNKGAEAIEFLGWLKQSHFTFLGFRDFDYVIDKEGRKLKETSESRLGLFKNINDANKTILESGFSKGMKQFLDGEEIVGISKSSTRARVHRSIYPDYIVVKKFAEDGSVCGEVRFLGMFTYAVYSLSPMQIPIVRKKIENMVKRSGLDPISHNGKNFRRVIENFPRDELFQSSEDELFSNLKTVSDISERHVIKLIMREDGFGNFVNCMVYVPRDLYNTSVRIRIQELIGNALNTQDHDSTTFFSESILARAQFVFRLGPDDIPAYDVSSLEADIANIVRDWGDHLQTSLIEEFGESDGIQFYSAYDQAFSSAYQEYFDARIAAHDVRLIQTLQSSDDVVMKLYQPVDSGESTLNFRLLRLDHCLELSDIIPILENFGLRVLSEHPFQIEPSSGQVIWIHEYQLKHALGEKLDVSDVRENFEQACQAVWHKKVESDPFNKLVLAANLDWRQVYMLRAYARYMKQTAFAASHHYIAETLALHTELSAKLARYFELRFNPEIIEDGGDEFLLMREDILSGLDNIANLNEDRVLRRYVDLMDATLRTNYYQVDEQGNPKYWLSTKFNPEKIPDIPKPKPEFEIFVYSPRIEGVHLRGGKVARGGLRWSDRIQDYRTEVLGLVKAQQVKNAVIVPEGAKGGFVAKYLNSAMSRDEMQAEGIACYKIFIRGLLDITDNLVDGKIVPPVSVVRHDEDDPYLVVAADKGTATFSDIANEISLDRKHWLGDAFASGGSQGYDHKGMGITAKGAWVSVQRHFREKGLDIQKQDFTVIGIGDMAGDVFGNGMLLSEHICLQAAFNHMHIFIDPHPDAAASFKERKRLFETPRTTWDDYNKELISKGGGVFSRQAKFVNISDEMKSAFGISENRLNPTELINVLLKAPVDLLWNGGIGTYVKSSLESHAVVGDKANDSLRVNGNELRCKVFGEGGNLGATQLGRVEYCLAGGACNTDFIDNAAGVDCSDHEVNIKILLDTLVKNGDLTSKHRNKFLAEMTDEVSDLVLHNNYMQTQALSVSEFQSGNRVNENRRFIQFMEAQGRLDRKLEFLPTDEAIVERQGQGKSLTRPELSVLISYAKVMMKEILGNSTIAEDDYICREVESAFPKTLREKYNKEIYEHRLKKEIVGTQVANSLINNLGITAGHRLLETTGASLAEIAKAFIVSRDVFQLEEFNAFIKSQDNKMASEFQAELLGNMMRRVRRGTRWFLRNRRSGINPEKEVKVFRDGLDNINAVVSDVVEGASKEDWCARKQRLIERDVPEIWASRLTMPDNLFSGLGVVEAALETDVVNEKAAEIFFLLLDRLNLGWFASQLSDVKVESYWQAIARESFIDDLEAQLRKLTICLVKLKGENTWKECLGEWEEEHQFLVDRWKAMVNEVQGAQVTDYAMFSVALRELIDLTQATSHKIG